eukprot:133420-Amorphochlora_amoeboformis.AAC.1
MADRFGDQSPRQGGDSLPTVGPMRRDRRYRQVTVNQLQQYESMRRNKGYSSSLFFFPWGADVNRGEEAPKGSRFLPDNHHALAKAHVPARCEGSKGFVSAKVLQTGVRCENGVL